MSEQPFGTESEPEGTSPGVPDAPEPAPAPAAEVAPAEPPAVPGNQPAWMREAFTYLHERTATLEALLADFAKLGVKP